MRPAWMLLALLPLAACAPQGSHYEGFTLVSNGPYNDPNAYARDRAEKKMDQWAADHPAAVNAYAQQFWNNRPINPVTESEVRAQDQMNVDRLYWAIGEAPPELYP